MLSRSNKIILAILVLFFGVVGFLAVKKNYSEARTEVCFCHNVNHNPHTICTSEPGLIEGHMGHVNNGQDTLGSCPEPSSTPTPTPTSSLTPTPGDFSCFPCLSCEPQCSCPIGCPCPTWPLCPTPTEPEPTPTEPEPTPTPTSPPGNGGDGDDGGDGSPGEPWSCGAMKPPAPILLSVTPSTSVDLAWIAVEPVTHYQIAYGLSSGDYLYGVDNTGNVTLYNVGGLDPGADYCFAVRAINDCMPSDLSNEICTGEVGRGQVLGATTLADTGSFSENLVYLLFIMGSVCSGVGLRLLSPAKKPA